jgi:hypothetical protein
MTNTAAIPGERISSFIERVERIDEEIKALNEGKKEVFAEAKGEAFDVSRRRHRIRPAGEGAPLRPFDDEIRQPVSFARASLGLLLFDAFNTDDAESRVFIGANVRLNLLLFRLEGLERVHVRELQQHHTIGRRCSPEANRFVEAASDALATKCFDVALRLGQIVLAVGVLVFDVDFGKYVRWRLALRVQNVGGANA